MKKRILPLIMLVTVLVLTGCSSDKVNLPMVTGVQKSEIRYAYENFKPVDLEKVYELCECNLEECEGTPNLKDAVILTALNKKEEMLFMIERSKKDGSFIVSGIEGKYYKVAK